MANRVAEATVGRWDGLRLARSHATINRAICGLLDLIVELDTDEIRFANSVTDMAAWVQFDLGLEAKTARSWVRVARALVDLPLTRRAFRAGEVSFDEVRILCRHATPANEAALLAITSETQADDLAAAIRSELDLESRRRARPESDPWLQMWWSEDESHLKLRGEIPGVDGLLVETALRRLASKAPRDPATGLFTDPDLRNAEALVQIASESTAEDRDHDRATLVVHLDAAEVASGITSGTVGKHLIDRDELLRLACDPRLQPAIDDPTGATVGIGRTSRKIPPWLRRLVENRDKGCRFPGCGRTRWTQIHYVIHWANRGPTNLDNLVQLCGFHHRMIHRKGWKLAGNPNADLVFLDQWGSRYRPARSPIGPDHAGWLLEHLGHYHDYRLGRLAAANSPP